MEFLIAVERINKFDTRGYFADWDYSSIHKRGLAIMKERNGRNVPLVGGEDYLKDGRLWYPVELIRGTAGHQYTPAEFTPELVSKIVEAAYELIVDMDGQVPIDMFNGPNYILSKESKEVVFIDFGSALSDLDDDIIGAKERISVLMHLIWLYGFNVDTGDIVFDSFSKVLGKEKALKFLFEIYQNMLSIGTHGIFTTYQEMNDQKYGSEVKVNKKKGKKAAKTTFLWLEQYLTSKISSFETGVVTEGEKVKFTKMFKR